MFYSAVGCALMYTCHLLPMFQPDRFHERAGVNWWEQWTSHTTATVMKTMVLFCLRKPHTKKSVSYFINHFKHLHFWILIILVILMSLYLLHIFLVEQAQIPLIRFSKSQVISAWNLRQLYLPWVNDALLVHIKSV